MSDEQFKILMEQLAALNAKMERIANALEIVCLQKPKIGGRCG